MSRPDLLTSLKAKPLTAVAKAAAPARRVVNFILVVVNGCECLVMVSCDGFMFLKKSLM